MALNRYPNLPIDVDTWPSSYSSGRLIDASMDGIESERILWKGTKIARLTLVHPFLNTDQVEALLRFYSDNEYIPFELNWRGDIVVCKFVSKPIPTKSRGWWTSYSSTVREV